MVRLLNPKKEGNVHYSYKLSTITGIFNAMIT